MRTAGFSNSLQRRENHYQNKRLKKYAETQSFLKELQTHPEILRPLSSPKPLNALQTVLFLSAITAAFPTRAQAATTKAPFNQDNAESNVANALVTPGSQPSQQAAKVSSLPPPLSPMHRMYGLLNVSQLASPQKWISSEVSLNRIMRNTQNVSAHTVEKPSVKKANHKNSQYTVRTKTKNKCTSAPRHHRQTINRLHTWVNQTAAIEKAVSLPSQALGAVLHHYQVDLPESFFTTLNPCLLQPSDWPWIDEAAQLWHEAQRGKNTAITTTTSTSVSPQHAMDAQQDTIKNNHPIRGLRKKFLADLKMDLKREIMLIKMFAPIVNGTNTEIFFDGTALRGAMGKSIDDLVALPALMQIPEYAPLIDLAKKELLIEKFKRMGESRDYAVGTAAYSLDSIIQRCRAFQGEPAEYFATEKALLEQLSAIAQRWQTQHDYPIEPQFALAQHLVHARGVEIRQYDWPTMFFQNEIAPWLKDLSNTITPTQIREINSWFYTTNMQGARDEPLTRKSAQTICEELQEIAYCARVPVNKRPQSLQAEHFYIAREAPNERYEKAGLCSTDSTIPAAIVTFAKTMQETGALPRGEVVVGDTPEQRLIALLAYRDDVFSSNYGQPPRFNRAQAVRTILHRHGLNDAQIDARRLYNTGPKLGIGAALMQDKEGTGIDEFLARSKKDAQSDGAIMSVNTENGITQIKTTGLLREAMLQWDNDLHTQPWIKARARENLRLAQAPITHTTVSAEAHQVAQNYKIGIAEQDIAGVENTLISMIPFVGGLYNIEEGIRHQNIDQAIGGVFSLAMDSLTTGIGAIAKIEPQSLGASLKVPHTEHAIVDMMKGVASDLDMPIDELMPLQTTTDTTGMHIHADPWKISLPDTNVPNAHRSLAARVRQGEKNVMWTAPTGEQYPVIHVVNQDRIIPAKHMGGTYHEVSWEDGEVLHHAPLIHHNKQGKNYFSMGLKGGGRSSHKLSGNTIVGHVKLKERYTIDALKTLFKEIPPPQLVELDIDEVEEQFTRHFPALSLRTLETDAPWHHLEHHLYTNLYFKSETFQRLANRFFRKNKNSWKIDFTANGPSRITHRGQASPHPAISIPNNDEIARLRYFGVDGQLHRFTEEQIYLDAILEAMNPTPHKTGSTLITSRAPNIVLRDRILFEAGLPPLPQQFSSCIVGIDPETGATINNYTPLHEQPLFMPSRQEVKTFELENRFMDKKWLNNGMEISAKKNLFGTPLGERITIKDIEKFYQETPAILEFIPGFINRVKPQQVFLFAPSDRVFLDHFYKNILRESSTFSLCWGDANANGLIGEQKWSLITDPTNLNQATSAQLIEKATEHGFAVDTETKIIYVPTNNIDDVYYLSDEGFIAMEKERRLVNAVVEMLVPMNPPEQKWLNRGGQVFFTDYILAEARINLPSQIAYGRVKGSEIDNGVFVGLIGANPLIYQTAARRARDMEDAYIPKIRTT